MSYFMTVSGNVSAIRPEIAELIPAHLAQPYVARLESRLESLDGGPVFLVHDGESGTSEGVVIALKEAFWEGQDPSTTALSSLLKICFESGISFRIWLAHNDPNDLVASSEKVQDLASALEVLRSRTGAYWHPE